MRVLLAVAVLVGCGSHGKHPGDAPGQPRDAAVDAVNDAPPDAPSIVASQCGAGVDGFAGSAIDWGCWDDYFTRDGAITQADALVLRAQGTSTYSAAQLATSYAFTGDFEFR